MIVIDCVNRAVFNHICDEYDLAIARDFIIEFNKGRNLRYHNTEHCFTVARLCHNLASLDSCYFTDWEMKMMIAAAMFHDFDHTGRDPDSRNIELAVSGMRHFFADSSETDKTVMEELIRVTEYPFVREPTSNMQRVIRDADLLHVYEPNHVETSIYGLRYEIEDQLGYDIPIVDFVATNKEFVSNIRWYTVVGKAIADASNQALFAAYDSYVKEPDDVTIPSDGLH